MSSLKDALLKAGFKPAKAQNERPKTPPAAARKIPSSGRNYEPKPPPAPPMREYIPVPKKIHSHQATRNFCEVCDRTQPDVEYFKHRNPTVQANWICISCADKNEIPDSTRTTAQSDMAKKKMFRRSFGATNMALRPEPSSGGSSDDR